MSLFSVQARKHTVYYDHLMSTPTSRTKEVRKVSDPPSSEDRRSGDKSRNLNKTYVISAVARTSTATRTRLTLQRRSRRRTGETLDGTQTSIITPAPEKRLTMQRRTKTPTGDRTTPRVSVQNSTNSKVLSESNGRFPSVYRSTSLRDTQARDAPSSSSLTCAGRPADHVFKTPTKQTQFGRIAAKRDVFEKLTARETPRLVVAKGLERSKSRVQQMLDSRPVPAPRGVKTPGPRTNAAPQVRTSTVLKVTRTPSTCQKPEESQSRTSEGVKTQHSLKMENSAVTVAVRLRPFNGRETTEEAVQVIFMNGQETVVQNPVSKQSYSFTYDFSFCSVDKTEAAFASQKTVYDTLARPLLLRAFEGFNTCLFAYGQTGSGKSYTMMGFGEEAGVIPRFCQELFCKLATMVTEEVKCHVEMSYFEVYNEKIHDLLVTRDEPNQRRMPLRVREHPVHGPYVAELSANVVGSYNDVKGWLELGNKQRATAATGMNDKSSRSHSVFTLVMTQTKTEYVEGEEHDHSITSRINLVDLAGSERCNSAQTSGDRLREGASINKSLLTLGKVISALSEQALSRKKVFTPYRESVLTWLLKESLGGNSKTTMIATLSPAGSNMEESLSTLRYAQQARTIINVAKVNEDTSAKLIRELKAEVEKLRAAQMSAQGIEPERVRLFQQEVAALKNRLCQQEREMLEANRAWREKLEQAEIRKREETKELQKAGVTFKVDNRLPNLVNLNEDPQLSEMLLYMIKEGRTTVGKLKSESSHDIQLNGALIADQHCTITNMDGTVSIIPKDNAKTFVNGNLITDTTVLHHGDRVILGGDHYFRFNHPAQVESGKRVSCWTGSGDGQKKDFEFAKNELLSAQRAQLEAEIEEAQVKAKEEMMQGIQMAKEVAQKELSEQKALYEERIQTLESELNQENESKRLQELQQQRVASQMEQLKMAKLELQQEVDSHKKRLRLHMEAQAMEDRRVCQARIVDALEAEKRKISKELEDIQKKRAMREVNAPRNAGSQWDSMKLSLMIEEANKISTNLNKKTVFSRHEGSNDDKPESGDALQVRVQNTKLGISTFWSLDRFQNNMAAMRELEQGDSTSKDDAVFYDPADEWEQDISSSSASTSSLSRRRSRSLLKSRRISGRLYEIRVHPIQSLNRDATQTCGLMGVNKPPSTHSSTSDSATPGICKDLVGQSLARLRSSRGPEESLADRLASDMYLVYDAIQTISSDYDRLDDDSQENVFGCKVQTQALLIKASAAVEGGVFVLLLWFSSVRPSSGVFYTLAEELKSQVKKMGGFLQMLIQGCESEITSMVTEARRKSGQCVDALMLALGHLASVTGTPLNAAEPGAAGKPSVVASLQKGVNKGVRSLLENNLQLTREMLREAQLAFPRNPILKSLKSKTLDLARALQNFMHHMLTKEREKASEEAEEGEDQSPSTLQTLKTYANKLFELKKSVLQLNTCLSSALRGKDGEANSSRELITASAKAVDELISARDGDETISSHHSSDQMVMGSREELHDALRSLLSTWDDPEETGSVNLEESSSLKDSSDGVRSGAGLKTMTKQHSHGVLSKGSPHWV